MNEKENLEIVEEAKAWRAVMIYNGLVGIIGILSVTYAAIYFNRIAVLWFYILIAGMLMRVKHIDNDFVDLNKTIEQ